MDQVEAAQILWNCVYVYYECPWDPKERLRGFMRGGKLLPDRYATKEELTAVRDRLLGKDFRFTWPERYVADPSRGLISVRYLDEVESAKWLAEQKIKEKW